MPFVEHDLEVGLAEVEDLDIEYHGSNGDKLGPTAIIPCVLRIIGEQSYPASAVRRRGVTTRLTTFLLISRAF